MIPIGLLLEGLVAILLILTVVYCFILDRRLRQLRSGQDGLKELIGALNSATERAQGGVAQLKIAGDAAGTDLREVVTTARELRDELALMVEAGNNIADRLEETASKPRESAESVPLGTIRASRDRADEQAASSVKEVQERVESGFLKALKEAR